MQEKNRHTLLRALGQLPEHQPPEQIWEALSFHLDEKEAEQPLRAAIRNLRDHEPPASLWENISEGMRLEKEEAPLRKAIAELPQYEPPAFVWNAIEEKLPKPIAIVKSIDENSKVVPLWRRPAIAAGITALICAMAWLVFAPSDAEKISIAYSTVEMDINFDDKEILRDEEAFQLVLNEFNHQADQLDDPYLEELRRELEDLNLAKRQLEEVMGAYGNDEDLIAQITAIEHNRSAVLKEMATKI